MSKESLDQIEDTILKTLEASLKAQLKAVRNLRGPATREEGEGSGRPRKKGTSQTDLALEVLRSVGRPLHINEIVEAVAEHHGRELVRDSLVSAITKKIAREEEFIKTARNTFAAR
jgi:hypothetical protein